MPKRILSSTKLKIVQTERRAKQKIIFFAFYPEAKLIITNCGTIKSALLPIKHTENAALLSRPKNFASKIF